MVSQVDVLSDREKEILTNYDRLGLNVLVGVCAKLQFRFVGLLTELLISHFFSRLYGFLRVQDPIGDPSLPDLTHKSLLLKVRIKLGNLDLVVFYAKFVNSVLSCTVTSQGA